MTAFDGKQSRVGGGPARSLDHKRDHAGVDAGDDRMGFGASRR
jgi:hypothetical protein